MFTNTSTRINPESIKRTNTFSKAAKNFTVLDKKVNKRGDMITPKVITKFIKFGGIEAF